jgi:hypothetical protein
VYTSEQAEFEQKLNELMGKNDISLSSKPKDPTLAKW